MSHLSDSRYRTLLIAAAVMTVVALAVATAAGACNVQSSSAKTGMEHMSTGAMEATMGTTAAPSTGTPMRALTGSASASSAMQSGWIARDNPASNDVSTVQGLTGLKARSMQQGAAGALDYGLVKFHVPSTNTNYEVRLTGIDSTKPFGGVGLLREVHGNTGVGDSSLPRTLAYVTAWGPADVYSGGQKIATAVPAHIMVAQGIRDPSNGQLLSTGNIDFNRIETTVELMGPVQGLADQSVAVTFPQSAIQLADVGGHVLASREIAMALLPGETRPGAVAGVAVQPQRISISATGSGFRTSGGPLSPGLTTFSVTNNSNMPRGLILRGVDVIGAPVYRYTQLLRPGQSTSFQFYVAPGSYQLMDYYGATIDGRGPWKSAYRSNFTVREF